MPEVDEGGSFIVLDARTIPVPTLTAPPIHSRHRIHSHPSQLPPRQLPTGLPRLAQPLSPQPPARRPPSISLNSPQQSPFLTSHSRVRSISSGPFLPPVSSPLANKFHVPLHPFEPASSKSQVDPLTESVEESPIFGHAHGRRHSLLQSRNLSSFFPRPHATISEDPPLDIESAPLPPNTSSQSKLDTQIPVSQSEPLQMGHDLTASFSFGSSATVPKSNSTGAMTSGMTTRRGHHHKHSLSHNFFSFLDPGSIPLPTSHPETRPEDLHTAPTPAPMSPWSSVTNIPNTKSTSSTTGDFTMATISPSTSPSPAPSSSSYTHTHTHPSNIDWNPTKHGLFARVVCVLQFCLGALVWVRGQAVGSLACTGLGYWVVFDAFGIAVGGPLLHNAKVGFSSARTRTTLLFAQCVYLMFAGVYVAKEAIEHILLSGGHVDGHSHTPSPSPLEYALNASAVSITNGLGLDDAGEMGNGGHHHHWGDERPEVLGLRYPLGLVILVFFSLLATSVVFEQHDVLVKVTNTHIRIPSPLSLLQRSRPLQLVPTRGHGRWGKILRNPYALPPILFCLAILGGELVLNVTHYTPFDLSLAALQVVITTRVAYAACVVLGGVLLQTAPAAASFGMRSSGGALNGVVKAGQGASATAGTFMEASMEAFWQVVREIERHEHVVGLPTPHVWQVCPPGQASLDPGDSTFSSSMSSFGLGSKFNSGSSLFPSESTSSHSSNTMTATQAVSAQLIITLSPHVSASLPDEEVLKLTRWAAERVRRAFGSDGERKIGFGVEVCVGILRD